MSRLSALHLTTAVATLALGTACGADSVNNPGGSSGAGATSSSTSGAGPTSNGGTAPIGAGTSGASTGTSGSSPGTFAGAGGAPSSSTGGMSSSTSGAGGGLALPHPTNSDHCLYGYTPEASDDTMAAGPVVFSTPGGDDTTFQPEVLKWMEDNKWRGAHVIWHAVRGCTDGTAAGLLGPLGYPNI
ncbi:MAG TPA: hypothetical protein VEQ58_00290, partial [Polyangiaceae bacterium]|nr:hypothetical protein [Polyangiaceae bacterium]